MSDHHAELSANFPPTSHIKPVVLKGGLLGHQIVEPRKRIDLSSMFNHGVTELADEAENKYSAVYFRTKGGKIFQLTHPEEGKGQLIGPSNQGGGLVTETFYEGYVGPNGLIVGQVFTYNGPKFKPVVTEIVGVVIGSPGGQEGTKPLSGPVSSIIEDFEAQSETGN